MKRQFPKNDICINPPLVIFDLDNTIFRTNALAVDRNAFTIEHFSSLPVEELFHDGALELIIRLKSNNVRVAVATNSFLSPLREILERRLKVEGVRLDGYADLSYFDADNKKDAAKYQKPGTYLADILFRQMGIDPANKPPIFMIGDQDVDMRFAHKIGAQGILVDTIGYGVSGAQSMRTILEFMEGIKFTYAESFKEVSAVLEASIDMKPEHRDKKICSSKYNANEIIAARNMAKFADKYARAERAGEILLGIGL